MRWSAAAVGGRALANERVLPRQKTKPQVTRKVIYFLCKFD